MTSIDYSRLAEETADEHAGDEGTELSDQRDSTRRSSAAAKRPRKLTDEERLANALASVASLQEKVTAQRASNREAMIEQLYLTYRVEAIDGDLSEAKRLAALSARITEATSA